MATVPTESLSQGQKAFLACSYALMIIEDEGLEFQSNSEKEEKVAALITAAGLSFPPYYSKFFVSNMAGVNIGDMMAGKGGAPGGGDAGAGGDAGEAAEGNSICSNFSEVVEEVVKKPAEVVKVSLGGGGGLFGGDSSSDDDDSDEDSDES
jgi:large subunit ribosomal protein LP1